MVDKNSIFGGMLTTQGAAKKTNCDALGIPWEPRYMLIGDANGTDPVPSPSQTKLVNQVYRAQLNQLRVSPTDDNILIAELVLPPDVGGWWIRELALEDKDGVFSAVANAAPSYKPLLAQGSGRNQVVRMHIITSGTANIQLKIDPSVVLATRQYVDDSINTVLPKNKTPGEWTRVKTNDRGLVVSGDNPSTLAGMGITDAFTKAQIEAMIAQASALPVGATVAFPLDKVAPGFLELDGSIKSIAAYPDLATFLGTAFNKGDEGAGNFRLPESRGEFLRGWDHGRGVDAGRAVGSWQKGTMVSADTTGSGDGSTVIGLGANAALPLASYGIDPIALADYPSQVTALSSAATASSNVAVSGSARPRNLAVMWCIKAWNAPINQGNIDIAALAAMVEAFADNGPIAGNMRGDRMLVAAASAGATIKVDEVIVSNATGKTRTLRNFSQLIDLSSATKGLGAMDVGAAPVNGYVALYAFYNPDTKVQGAMAFNCTSVVAPVTYGGTAALAGYTFSALVGVWPTNGSGQFPVGFQEDRVFSYNGKQVLSTTVTQLAYAAFTVASAVPMNAKQCQGYVVLQNSLSGANSYAGLGGVGGVGGLGFASNPSGGVNGGVQHPFPFIPLTTAQTLHHILSATTGVATFTVNVTAYKF
jgi:microcystin-dependent protein